MQQEQCAFELDHLIGSLRLLYDRWTKQNILQQSKNMQPKPMQHNDHTYTLESRILFCLVTSAISFSASRRSD